MVFLNGTDITKGVQESTYKVDSVPVYKEWTDGSHTIHRTLIRNRVEGSFDVVFIEGYSLSIDQFNTLLSGATDSEGRVHMKLSVSNLNVDKDIVCFVDVKSYPPRKVSSELVLNRAKLTIKEC